MKNFFILGLLVIVVILSSCTIEKQSTYLITETYRITSKSDSTTFIRVDLPISYGYQDVKDIIVTNAMDYSTETHTDYKTILIELNGSGVEEEVTIKYEVTLYSDIHNFKEENFNYDSYLLPSQLIDSDNEIITKLANDLIVNGNKYETARNISKYVTNNIEIDSTTKVNPEILKSSQVLINKEGVCGDYAHLMTALLRAAGIPAKSINGLVLNNLSPASDWASSAGSHAWVEFYIDGNWYFDDPTWGNKYFSNTDTYHLSYGTHPIMYSSREYQAILNEIEANQYKIIGAMTAPIKFIAYSDDSNALIIPKVDIVKK